MSIVCDFERSAIILKLSRFKVIICCNEMTSPGTPLRAKVFDSISNLLIINLSLNHKANFWLAKPISYQALLFSCREGTYSIWEAKILYIRYDMHDAHHKEALWYIHLICKFQDKCSRITQNLHLFQSEHGL